MSGRAWDHLLEVEVGEAVVRLRYLRGDELHEQTVSRQELSTKLGYLWGRGHRRKLTLSHEGQPMMTQCAGKDWTNDKIETLHAALASPR